VSLLGELFETAAARHGDRVALAGGEAVTYSEVARAARVVAAGLEPGDRHFVQLPNGPEWLAEFWGAMIAGAVAVPLNPRGKPDEIAYVKAHARRLAPLPPETAVLLYTSGTTGTPKGVMLSHEALALNAANHADAYGLQGGDAVLVPNPFTHILGLVVGCIAPATSGYTVVTQPAFDPATALGLIGRWRPVGLLGAPPHFQMLATHPALGEADVGSVRWGFSGAAAQSPEAIRLVLERLELEVLMNGYGMTEASGGISHTGRDDPVDVHATTVGRPWPWIDARSGQDGELLVRSGSLMLGYYDDPEATAAAVDAGGWLHTGDLVDVGEDGLLRFRGRLKEMINSGGLKVYPAEVERVLASHPTVSAAAVVPAPDDRLGEVPVAFVVLSSPVEPEELRSFCEERLSGYKVPRRYEAVDALPTNSSGKVQKFLLAERARS
jgi:acyl-CoA synthetase (AMP-forming)/AMP-acid ligase II